ncbi:SIMPL domain-containing protein [Myceligenerans crystallogenes]|uniref:SIMPL domain-containing protein n=1 Tax=Myceligenerans crystallogenes TaxID=316335 RepID=A0ABN2N929_9MICO
MTLIAVGGYARRSRLAEIARVRVGVTREGLERGPVLREASDIHATLVAQLKQHSGDGVVDTWESTSVRAYTYTEWRGKREKRAERFRATSSVQADFVDFEALSRWLPEIADVDGVSIGGVDWALKRETREQMQTEVRADAARETRARAAAYADALGLDEPRCVGLFESGLRPGKDSGGSPNYPVPAPAAAAPSFRGAAAGAAEPPPPPQFELEPPELDVTISITADYEA